MNGSINAKVSGSASQETRAPALAVRGPRGVAWWMYVLVAVAALAVYANSIRNDFALDDVMIVQNNAHVQNLDWAQIWSDNYWPKEGGVAPDILYRPLTIWTYLVNQYFTPGASWAFHLTNVLLHALVSLLVMALAWRLFGHRRGGAGIALASGLLFALHPLHTEAVANTVGRAELLAALFSLLALLVYLPAGPLMEAPLERRAWWHGLLPAACFFAAMLSKETPVTLLAAFLFIDCWRWTHAAERPSIVSWLWRRTWRYYAPLLASFGVYMAMRINACGLMESAKHTSPVVNPLMTATVAERIVTPFVLFGKYIMLFLWPRVLSADYSAPSLMPVSDPLASGALLGILFAALLVIVLVRAWKRWPSLALALALFVCAYGLIANVLRIGTIFGERLFYWPSVFAVMVVGWAFVEAMLALGRMEWKGVRRAMQVAAACLAVAVCGLLSARTVTRNTDWSDNIALSIATARDNAKSVKALYWAGITLVNKGPEPWMRKFGVTLLERAVKTYPTFGDPWFELAKAYGRDGDFVKSVEYLAKAAMYKPGSDTIRAALDAVRAELRTKDAATCLSQFKQYADGHPKDAAAVFALSLAYGSHDRDKDAEAACARAFALDPSFHEAAYELALVRHAEHEPDGAVTMLRQYVMNVRYNADVRCLMAQYLMELDPAKHPTALAEAAMNLDKAEALGGAGEKARAWKLREQLRRLRAAQASVGAGAETGGTGAAMRSLAKVKP